MHTGAEPIYLTLLARRAVGLAAPCRRVCAILAYVHNAHTVRCHRIYVNAIWSHGVFGQNCGCMYECACARVCARVSAWFVFVRSDMHTHSRIGCTMQHIMTV